MNRMLSQLKRSPGDPVVLQKGPNPLPPTARIAKGLGWFSLALGVAELVAPRPLGRALGLRGHTGLLRAYGAREIASGVAVLSVDPRMGLWARVGGDLLDLGTLALLPRRGSARVRRNLGIAMAAVAGVALLDALCASALQQRHARGRAPLRDYSQRSGFRRPPEAMRGIAREAANPVEYRHALPRPGVDEGGTHRPATSASGSSQPTAH